jgi:hypothetical protein
MSNWVFKEGDSVVTPFLDKGTVLEYLGEFDFPKVRVLIDGAKDSSVWYADTLRLDTPKEEVERILVRAEYSESTDALTLSAEIRRLRSATRAAQSEAWEKGMSDAKLQALGIRPSVRNPYLED